MTKTAPTRVGVGLVLALAVGAAVPGGAAAAQPAPRPVGPHQAFVGLVNGKTVQAAILVVCPGPLRVDQTGPPAPGQTLGIASPTAVTPVSLGYTGSAATSIVAQIVPASTTASPVVTFQQYGTQVLPTTLRLPCSGTSAVVFRPQPSSATARSAQVTVRFEATCLSVVCPVVSRAGRTATAAVAQRWVLSD